MPISNAQLIADRVSAAAGTLETSDQRVLGEHTLAMFG
jgi:hypothetical protein